LNESDDERKARKRYVSADLGELTKDIHDDEPHRRKVQTAKSKESFLTKPKRIGAVVAKKTSDYLSH